MKQLLQRIDVRLDGAALFLVLFLFMDFPIMLALILNVFIHEFGHMIALIHYGCRIQCIAIDCSGLCIRSNLNCLSNRAALIVAISGPLLGGTIGGLTSMIGAFFNNDLILLFSGIGLLLTVFNLLPAKPLDGWRIIDSLLPRWSQIVGVMTALLLLLIGVILLYSGYGSGLAFMGMILLLQDYDSHVFL